MSRNEKEKAFQKHICKYLNTHHGYTIIDQDVDVTDKEYCIAENLLLAFIKSTQSEKFAALEKDYGADSGDEIIRALKDELRIKPLWLIIRHGLSVRQHEFKLYFPQPRSNLSADANTLYEANRISFKDEFVIKGDGRIDIVLYLNGLPIITIELKHEDAGQVMEDAVTQYTKRNQNDKIFELPFLHIAADTSDVRVATNPFHYENFRWFNTGLMNSAIHEGEYPVEYLYSEVLSKQSILSYLSFFLIYVPHTDKHDGFSIFPRYHQMRSVNKLSIDILENFEKTNTVGKNYLINHSAGSGKTLTMSWAADKFHSLYKKGTQEKAIDIIFILTDRKDLDKNVSDELLNLTHLKEIVGYAKNGENLGLLIKNRKSIIVSTVHKFGIIIDELIQDSKLKDLNIAFLIDEAHRSQDGKMGVSVREPFRKSSKENEGDVEPYKDPEADVIDKIAHTQNKNMIFVAFTATPSQKTVTLFGDPFDIYSEAEAIEEGYILDVASNIISYETLYNMDSKVAIKDAEEKLYPKGVIARALKNIAFADEGLIQYKSEIMLRIFQEDIAHLINGKAKAMIVTSSRPAGLMYFKVLQAKLAKRDCGFPCKVLFAFSDFTHPETNEVITEFALNNLQPGELIQDRFKEDDHRLLVVANKFQTGFDEPFLAGMFLDKAVADRNAVQTLSRLNRCADGKDTTVVVDFTNNAETIFKAFKKYREGSPYEPKEPTADKLYEIADEIKKYRLFSDEQIAKLLELEAEKNDPVKMGFINQLRAHFTTTMPDFDERVSYVYLMSKLIKQYHFLSAFFEFDKAIADLVEFSEIIASQLIKQGSESELMIALKKIGLSKANVEYKGIKELSGNTKKAKPKSGGGGNPPPKVTLTDMIDSLKEKFKISDEEAIIIKEVCEEKLQDENIVNTIHNNQNDLDYLRTYFSSELRESIVDSYVARNLEDRIMDSLYDDKGAILDSMTGMVISHELFNIGKVAY